MSTVENAIGAGGATPPATVKVWDPLVRVFHWSLATLFVTAYLTGEDGGQVHIGATWPCLERRGISAIIRPGAP